MGFIYNIQLDKKNLYTNKLLTFQGIIGIISKGWPIVIKDLLKEIASNRKVAKLERIFNLDEIADVKSISNLTRHN